MRDRRFLAWFATVLFLLGCQRHAFLPVTENIGTVPASIAQSASPATATSETMGTVTEPFPFNSLGLGLPSRPLGVGLPSELLKPDPNIDLSAIAKMPEPLRLAALDPFGEKRKYWDSEGGEVPARPAEMSQRPTDKNAPAKEVDREAKQDLETADLFSAIDRAIQQMKKANIAFNAPKTLNRDATVTIHLLLSMRETKESLLAMVKGPGEKETATVPVTGIMQAQLSGSNFQLTAITPEEQPISRGEKTEWKWNVKPTTAGEQRLHLTLNAIVTIRGTERKRAIRTFDHTIVVNVTAGQQLADFVSTNWKWLWAAVSAPVAGAVWRNRRKRKSRAVSG